MDAVRGHGGRVDGVSRVISYGTAHRNLDINRSETRLLILYSSTFDARATARRPEERFIRYGLAWKVVSG